MQSAWLCCYLHHVSRREHGCYFASLMLLSGRLCRVFHNYTSRWSNTTNILTEVFLFNPTGPVYPPLRIKRQRRTHRDDAELDLLVQLQSLLLYHLRHVEVELRVLSALDEPRVVCELDHYALVRKQNNTFKSHHRD